MEIEECLNSSAFTEQNKNIFNLINQNKASDFVRAMISTMIKKYGIEKVRFEAMLENPYSMISTHITHIIEVGGLKIISDNGIDKIIDVNDRQNFQNIIISTVLLLNCSLAIELNKFQINKGSLTNYYNGESMITIANRLAKHTIDGLNYSNGFEHYASIMVIDNLINGLSS